MQHPSSLTEALKNLPTFLGLGPEPPQETVLILPGGVEVRRLAPLVLAQLTLAGDFDDAFRRGRERLQRYVDGANEHGATVPASTETRWWGSVDGWCIARVLAPSRIEALPRPRSRDVRLATVPEQIVAAMPYRGEHDAQREAARTRLLEALLASPDCRVTDHVHWATVGSPALSFLQRHEARVELDPRSLARPAEEHRWALSWLAAALQAGV